MFKFIHSADIHLDSALRGLDRYEGAPVEQIRGATRRALENLVRLAVDEAVQFVVIAGDVYDGDWTDFNTGLFFVRQMSRLKDAGIPVVLIRGNHDAQNKMTRSLKLPDNVRMLSTVRPETVTGAELGGGLADLDVAFHGQGFQSAKVEENVAKQYPAKVGGCFNIGVLHTSLDMEAGGPHARYAPCSPGDLQAKGYDYWALGHIHGRRIVRDDPPLVFPGNIQGRHIREPGEKGAMLVRVADRGEPSLEFRSLDVFRWHELPVDATAAADSDEVLSRIGAAMENQSRATELPQAVRVLVSGATAAHHRLVADYERFSNEVRNAAVQIAAERLWVEKVQLRTTPPDAGDRGLLDDGPLQEVLACLAEWRAEPAALAEIDAALTSLRSALPAGLTGGDDAGLPPLDLSEPDFLKAALDDVQSLLLSRLQSAEAGR